MDAPEFIMFGSDKICKYLFISLSTFSLNLCIYVQIHSMLNCACVCFIHFYHITLWGAFVKAFLYNIHEQPNAMLKRELCLVVLSWFFFLYLIVCYPAWQLVVRFCLLLRVVVNDGNRGIIVLCDSVVCITRCHSSLDVRRVVWCCSICVLNIHEVIYGTVKNTSVTRAV